MGNPEIIFARLKSDGYKVIQDMIEKGREENLFLDFKEKSNSKSQKISKEDKKNYAKALSGFSNSSGGVLIWGIKAKRKGKNLPDIAFEEKPIEYLKKFLTDLNSLVGEAIFPLNPKIQNVAIHKNGEENCGFIATYVPESELVPHRALLGLNKYYMRVGESFKMMEHYHLEDAFGRRQRPKLSIHYRMNVLGYANIGPWFQLIIGMKNGGKYIAKYPGIRIKMLSDLHLSKYGVDGNYNWLMPLLKQPSSKTEDIGYLFGGDANTVIHPSTNIEVAIFEFREKHVNVEKLNSSPIIKEGIRFEYELYAEKFKPISGTVTIPQKEVIDFLKR
ncbi:MAG: helix-turn-helix domain-containing protein [Methanosarcinales archaeon]